jgi:hypothetical protein
MAASLPAHATPLHGRSVNSFADLGQLKYWMRATLPVSTFGFFFYHTLDHLKVTVVCPHLAAPSDL